MRAALDLLRHIPVRAPRRIADVYKERGSMRALLARRFPHAEIETIDLSQSMIVLNPPRPASSARARPEQVRPDLFQRLAGDGVVATAIVAELVGMGRAGGCVAAEFPNDLYEPSRALIRMIAADGPWAKTLLPIAKTRPFNETMEDLYAVLGPTCAAVDIWEATYLHAMAGVAAIVEWMEATSLAPFLTPLSEADRGKFLDRYAAELRQAYPALPDGQVLFRSRRLFVFAQP